MAYFSIICVIFDFFHQCKTTFIQRKKPYVHATIAYFITDGILSFEYTDFLLNIFKIKMYNIVL